MKKLKFLSLFLVLCLLGAHQNVRGMDDIIKVGAGVNLQMGYGSQEKSSEGKRERIYRPFFPIYGLGLSGFLDFRPFIPVVFLHFEGSAAFTGVKMEYDYTVPENLGGGRYTEDIRADVKEYLLYVGPRARFNPQGFFVPLLGAGVLWGDMNIQYNAGDYKKDKGHNIGFVRNEDSTIGGAYLEGGMEFKAGSYSMLLSLKGLQKKTDPVVTLGRKAITARELHIFCQFVFSL